MSWLALRVYTGMLLWLSGKVLGILEGMQED